MCEKRLTEGARSPRRANVSGSCERWQMIALTSECSTSCAVTICGLHPDYSPGAPTDDPPCPVAIRSLNSTMSALGEIRDSAATAPIMSTLKS